MPKPLTVWITTNWKILQEMGIPDHLTWLLRNVYAGQEATVSPSPPPLLELLPSPALGSREIPVAAESGRHAARSVSPAHANNCS